MMATRHLTASMAALLVACVAAAQQPKRQAADWNVTNGTIAVKNYQGKKALHLVSSKKLTLARRRGMSFRDGTIELDIAAPGKGNHYLGVAFRVQDKVARNLKVRDSSKRLFENIYFRPFASGTGNAIQYCASGTKCNWSYLRKNYPGVYEAKTDLSETGWFHVKIVIAGVTAKVYVNDATTPDLVVKDLKHGLSEGGVGLTTYHKSAYFANLKVTARAEAQQAKMTVLIPKGAVWKYLDDGSDQGTEWKEAGFDDSAWKSGPAKLGYGGKDVKTQIGFGPESEGKFITAYFRHAFQVEDPTSVAGLKVELLRDDGAVLYLNGKEVHRENMPAGKVTAQTKSTGAVGDANENRYFKASLEAVLQKGRNVIAVEVHQWGGTSSDTGFDLQLNGM